MLRTESAPERAGPDLANLLFGAYRFRVLSLLLLRPGDRFHVRMIARLTGIPAGSLHRELRQLADAGLLVAIRSGNQVLYSANEASPVFHELAAMLDKTSGTTPTLHEHAAEYTVEPAGRLPEIDLKALAADLPQVRREEDVAVRLCRAQRAAPGQRRGPSGRLQALQQDDLFRFRAPAG